MLYYTCTHVCNLAFLNRLLWSTQTTLDEMPAATRQHGLALMSQFTHYYIATHNLSEAKYKASSYTTEGPLQSFNELVAHWPRDVEPMRLIASCKQFGR